MSLPLALRQAMGIGKILCMKALARLRPLPLTRTIASQVLPGVGVRSAYQPGFHRREELWKTRPEMDRDKGP